MNIRENANIDAGLGSSGESRMKGYKIVNRKFSTTVVAHVRFTPKATTHRIKSRRSASAAMQKGSKSVANGEFSF